VFVARAQHFRLYSSTCEHQQSLDHIESKQRETVGDVDNQCSVMSSSAGVSDAEDQEEEEEEEEEEKEQILRKPDREFSYRDPAVRKACQSVCCMYVSVCARVFTCTCMHTTYMHAHICPLMRSHVMCAYMSQYKPLRFYLCACICACVWCHVYMNVFMHTHIQLLFW